MSEKRNVVKMNRGLHLNVGVVVFVIIIIYIGFNLFSYFTSDTVSEYEVGQGTIATNHIYHGLILRDETVVYAGQSGYINYYVKNASKASVNDIIYSIDTNGKMKNCGKYIRAFWMDVEKMLDKSTKYAIQEPWAEVNAPLHWINIEK